MSEETQVEAQAETPEVTVNDLVNAYAVIDLASKRGAFQAAELSAVGAVANKIKSFIAVSYTHLTLPTILLV